MFSFFSNSSGGANGTEERKRANSEKHDKMKMLSNMKISYSEMIRYGRDLSSNHGSSNRNNPDNAGNVYDFNRFTKLAMLKQNASNTKVSTPMKEGAIQLRNFKKNMSEL